MFVSVVGAQEKQENLPSYRWTESSEGFLDNNVCNPSAIAALEETVPSPSFRALRERKWFPREPSDNFVTFHHRVNSAGNWSFSHSPSSMIQLAREYNTILLELLEFLKSKDRDRRQSLDELILKTEQCLTEDIHCEEPHRTLNRLNKRLEMYRVYLALTAKAKNSPMAAQAQQLLDKVDPLSEEELVNVQSREGTPSPDARLLRIVQQVRILTEIKSSRLSLIQMLENLKKTREEFSKDKSDGDYFFRSEDLILYAYAKNLQKAENRTHRYKFCRVVQEIQNLNVHLRKQTGYALTLFSFAVPVGGIFMAGHKLSRWLLAGRNWWKTFAGEMAIDGALFFASSPLLTQWFESSETYIEDEFFSEETGPPCTPAVQNLAEKTTANLTEQHFASDNNSCDPFAKNSY